MHQTDRPPRDTLTARRPHSIWLLAALLFSLSAAAQATGELYGHVRTLGADRQPLALAGARIVLTSKADPSRTAETASDETGTFQFSGVSPAAYTLTVSLQDYESKSQETTVEAGTLQEVNLELKFAPVREEVTVEAEKPANQLHTPRIPYEPEETRRRFETAARRP